MGEVMFLLTSYYSITVWSGCCHSDY